MARNVYTDIEYLMPNLRAYARSLARNRDDADDLVQTCLERALRNLDSFREGTNLQAWLFTILRNAFFNERRRAARWANSVDPSENEHLIPVAPRQEHQLDLRDVARVLERLSPEHRRVLTMCGIDGMSYDGASRELGVPVGTVRSRLSRARASIRQGLAPEGEGPRAA